MKFDGLLKAKSDRTMADGDYIGTDGLIHCGVCGEPKEFVLTVLNNAVVGSMCKCEEMEYNKRIAEQRKQEQVKEAESRRQIGFPDSEMRNWNFEKDDSEESEIGGIARRYVEHFEEIRKDGKGLLLFGSVGTGKSFYSACIANALIDKGYSALMTNFSRITNALQSAYDGKQRYLDDLCRYDLLILDDLNSERSTQYMNEIVYTVIDSRYRSGKPLIVTTNLTAEELKNADDVSKQRVYSRLFEMCIPYEVKGTDRRRKKLSTDYEKYKKMLNF